MAPSNATRIAESMLRVHPLDHGRGTYPSELIIWPEDYTWTGTWSSDGRCTTDLQGVTVLITSNPQPTGCYGTPYVTCIATAEDPKGLLHRVAFDYDYTWWQLNPYAALMPDQPVLSVCNNWYSFGPNWGGFTQTSWYTAHNIVTVGEDRLYPTLTSDVPSRSSDSTPVATGLGR
ncbi:hypothetical protein O1611_g8630 [Lasiodiplodia mahajangana]|uniref:Uncharacterized protein n=1 Tax=Lasiodiplodia mahajangana TaxID=1108764 RepID=A0ACC2JC29_9PEZI|nr:hypothetical protein O1611_g8630 [Lasiodiplodia mahajangana]